MCRQPSKMFRKTITFSFLFFFASVIALANSQTAFSYEVLTFLHNIPFGDKIMHFLLVGTLAVVLNLYFCHKKVTIFSKKVLLGSLITLIFITLEECSQYYIPNRNFEIMDMCCNYAGIFGMTQLFDIIKSSRFMPLQPQ
ncbi:MAG: VanZ family protein [Paraglaciecola sp.]